MDVSVRPARNGRRPLSQPRTRKLFLCARRRTDSEKMGIQFGDPPVPKYVSSTAFHFGLLVGMVVVVATTFAVDKLGNFMFRRGYAKPFYVLGRRLHHVWVYLFVPACYLAFCSLIVLGRIQLIHGMTWYRVGLVFPVLGVCLAIDFLGDKRKSSSTGLWRHEWVYALIPAYIFAFVVNVFV